MDLISRKSVAEKMARRRDYVGRPSDPDCIIADEPSVPAVPLDKLCEWLQENASLTHGTLISAAGWKYELTRWMEEQDAQKEN
jgi:hypothetical protein